MKRVALVGASSVGKTTVYELLKDRLPEFNFINESTRTVGKYGFPINEAGTSETQLAISSFHLEALLTPKDVILDRCYLDLLVYSTYMENISDSTYNYILDTWMRVKDQYTHFIYFPIEFTSKKDGIRSTNEEWRTLVDREFQKMIRTVKVPVLRVTGTPEERVSQILDFLK
jgi:uridine kinase